MAEIDRAAIMEELSHVRHVTDDGLDALQIAIYLEETLDVTLPDEYLTDEHLGSPVAVERILDAIADVR
jgi:hypothetical protein